MATYLTFTTLFADMQRYLERGGSALTDPQVFAQIPRLINGAERKIMQVLKLQGTIEVLVDPTGLGINQPVIPKPDRWRQTISMNFGTGSPQNTRTPLFPRSYEYCRSYWSDDTQTSQPEFYADYDYQHWLIVPTPDQNYPLEIMSYMQPPLLDDTNQTNFFTDYTPNMLLYGSLLEAAPFLKDDPRVATWKDFWELELSTLVPQDLQKILDRSAERNKP